jgi:acetyl-CoA carboxylase/biotin carboxylase 1
MVAWILTLKTPESPQGRRLVAIANDITFQSGAFSPKEDAVFRAATELALEQRIPIVYLAANSGARVGLSSEVREKIKVAWTDLNDPTKGFSYLYLSDQDHEALRPLTADDGLFFSNGPHPLLRAEKKEVDGEIRWILSDVIGSEDGIGVECLSGSGAIASAYCRAFREGYTITLVSGRTVGIGAYLARLGRRCIQRSDQPIILTGFSALNKLLGRTVYTSQMQLGGPKVMGQNGVR